MTPVARTRTFAPALALTFVFLAAAATPARADVTAFLGLSPTPDNHFLRGFSGGVSLIIIGFEFEYAKLSEDDVEQLPACRRIQATCWCRRRRECSCTPRSAAAATARALGDAEETHVGVNIGGGAKIPLIGPLRVRVDYRVFQLRGAPIHSTYQRFYVGGNIAF